MASLLIKGGLVVTMNPSRDEVVADVLVESGVISAIGSGLSAATETLDASGCIVMPGFVQTHVHLCQTLFRGLADDMDVVDWLRLRIWPLEQAHDERSAYDSARLAIAEMIRGGTTCALTMETVHHTERIFDAIVETGFRACSGNAMMDRLEPGTEMVGGTTEESLSASRALVDVYDGAADGRLRYAFCPRGSRNCSDELWKETVELARERNSLIHTHAAENERQTARLAAEGLSDVEYLHNLGATGPRLVLAHCVWVSPHEIELLAETGTKVTHCPSCNLKLASGIAPVPELLSSGVNVSLGADGAPANNNLDMFREMRLAALLHKPRAGPEALPAAEILEMATIGGARALGMDAEIGSVEVGKRADIVVLRRDALHVQPIEGSDVASEIVYAHSSNDVAAAVIDGRIVLRDGGFTELDATEIGRAANESAARVARRMAEEKGPITL